MGFIRILLDMIGLMRISEAHESYRTYIEIGYHKAMREVMDEMQRIYGRPSAEWAEHMYGFVSDRLHKTNAQQPHPKPLPEGEGLK